MGPVKVHKQYFFCLCTVKSCDFTVHVQGKKKLENVTPLSAILSQIQMLTVCVWELSLRFYVPRFALFFSAREQCTGDKITVHYCLQYCSRAKKY